MRTASKFRTAWWILALAICLVLPIASWGTGGAGHSDAPTGASRNAEGQRAQPSGAPAPERPAALLRAVAMHRAISRVSDMRGEWLPIGPSPTVDDAVAPTTTAARVLSLAFASQIHTLYVGTAVGGVWSSTDGGHSYRPLTDGMPAPSIASLAVDPADNRVVYAGTGDYRGINWDGHGVGIYRTTDGGDTWLVYGSDILAGAQVAAIALDPAHRGDLFAAVWSHSGPRGLHGHRTQA